jgi:hypothetical protein
VPVVVVSLSQVPLPILLVFDGVNLHSSALVLVEQEPVYTDMSPRASMDGMNAVASSLRNGRFGVIFSKDRFEADIVEDMLRARN